MALSFNIYDYEVVKLTADHPAVAKLTRPWSDQFMVGRWALIHKDTGDAYHTLPPVCVIEGFPDERIHEMATAIFRQILDMGKLAHDAGVVEGERLARRAMRTALGLGDPG